MKYNYFQKHNPISFWQVLHRLLVICFNVFFFFPFGFSCKLHLWFLHCFSSWGWI